MLVRTARGSHVRSSARRLATAPLRPMARVHFLAVALLLIAAPLHAVPVSYTANLGTSKGNPVTDVLILETDGADVHASVYGSPVPGQGLVTIMHDAPVAPARSLLLGLTDGIDENGVEKIQLVMFLDPAFAAAHAGQPFSTVFPGARHSETVSNLQAAAGGDAAALAWFTGTFFSGPAAGAAFVTGGAFVVAEFTGLDVIGENATAGNWMVTSFQSLPANDPNAQSGRVTAVLGETAKLDQGPFDVQLSSDDDGVFALDKTVLNDTGAVWRSFTIQLGSGLGGTFAASTAGDGLGFNAAQNNREETGAFPDVTVAEDVITFRGTLPPGESARFIVFITTNTNGPHLLTVRQSAGAARAVGAPALDRWALVLLSALLAATAWMALRRSAPGRPRAS